MSFSLPRLSYTYKSLEPMIDAHTMEIHYTKHHATYTENLNKSIENTKFKNLSIEEILKSGIDNPLIRNNAGGFYNHSLFWRILTSPKISRLSESFIFYIEDSFKSVDSFKEEFTDSAISFCGSGWTWLSICPKRGKLFISSTPNQDNPIMPVVDKIGIPILGLDIWEHAYYLKYKNKRVQYIKSFWKIVNWAEVFNLFKTHIILS
ncbi:superoxide dismutase, iron/manganese-dependent [Candidatus Uzinura diaspidicola str. ASNER]|uniref:Superoxide dismutase n=1 Tax=Candidatus Uzinura diaspidicola str. ASNER TaxID=1133592 RepID=L7VJG4_9FLAO|nr:superoxide dismutase, iron/manganese-dependent [Candidatus Uzinura diaspidicola str. ASNER]